MSPRLSPSEFFLRAQPDERLAALAAEGHGRAFATLVERHRRILHAHARRLVGSERAEDVVQQALLRAWTSLSRGDEVRHVAAWLHRIVHNVALSELSRSIASSEPLDDALRDPVSIEHTAERRLEVRAVLAGVAGLPERQRLALLGTEIEGRSRRQLASELGLSEGAVRQLVHRARAGVRASVAVVVPWPLVVRSMRASGWLEGGDTPWHPGADAAATATLAGSVVASGAVKAGTALLVAGALGGGFALHGGGGGGGDRHGSRVRRTSTAAVGRARPLRPGLGSVALVAATPPATERAAGAELPPLKVRPASLAGVTSEPSRIGRARTGGAGGSIRSAASEGEGGDSRPTTGASRIERSDRSETGDGAGHPATSPTDGGGESSGTTTSNAASPSSQPSAAETDGESGRSPAGAPAATAAAASTDGQPRPAVSTAAAPGASAPAGAEADGVSGASGASDTSDGRESPSGLSGSSGSTGSTGSTGSGG